MGIEDNKDEKERQNQKGTDVCVISLTCRHHKILRWSKFNRFADDKVILAQMVLFVLTVIEKEKMLVTSITISLQYFQMCSSLSLKNSIVW